MISVVIWKEYRQQRVVIAALAVLGALLLFGLPLVTAAGGILAQPETRVNLRAGAVALVYIQALVCGGLLFALEGELRTLAFLDALPGSRGRLWRAKFLAGGLLTVVMIALMMALSAAAGLFETWREAALTFAAMACAGLYGFAWGILFSSFNRGATNMILLSLAGQLAWGFFVGFAGALLNVTVSLAMGWVPSDPPVAFMVGLFVFAVPAAFAGSAFVFTRLDRSRTRLLEAAVPGARRRGRGAWRTLFWLAWRQARGFAAGLALFALLLGLMMFARRLLVWPAATLLIGVLCGVTAFTDEQEGTYRFLGDQRFPLGRLWLVKVGGRFAVAVAAALIVLAPSFSVALVQSPAFTQRSTGEPHLFFAHVFDSNIIGELCPTGVFLTTWLVAGFGAGCLCGLLFRSGLAAGVFALFAGTLLTAVWVPSMLGGGLHLWQALGAPLLLLLSTFWLMRPWAAGRIVSWTAAVRLTPFVVLGLLWVAGGLWYRVAEIPDVPAKADMNAFRASLPTPEQNEGGDLARRAVIQFADLRRELRSEGPEALPQAEGNLPELSPMGRADRMLEDGWKPDDADLAAWLDKLFAGEWVGTLRKSAALPPGVFEDLRHVTLLTATKDTDPPRQIAVVLAVRGLQRQAVGDDATYLETLRLGLHLSETLRRPYAADLNVVVGRTVEDILLKGLDRWMEKLNGRPDLLRQALGLLSQHLQATADDTEGQELVEELIIVNTVEDTIPFLEFALSNGTGAPRGARVREEEAEWVAAAWLTPWEAARRDRILRVMFWGDEDQQRRLHTDRSGQFGPLPQLGPYQIYFRLRSTRPTHVCIVRAMLLKLALRWYQADHGRPADKLEQLVPQYLLSIPTDPFSPDGQPFHYRLSKGEEIEWPEDPPPSGEATPGAPAAAMPGGSMGPAMNVPRMPRADAAMPGAPPPDVGMPGAPPVGMAPLPPGMNAPGFPQPAAPPPPHTRKVPAGQGILWSVGPDGHDDGGRRQTGSLNGEPMWREDVIFLVPLPPKHEGGRP